MISMLRVMPDHRHNLIFLGSNNSAEPSDCSVKACLLRQHLLAM